jgi:1-acyl-sn-glycerol-3-phosphate acyltransferase
VLGVFYRRIDVVGLERVPVHGPVIVAANHQNGLVDPMLLMAALPRRLVPLSKAPLFRHPLLAPFLRWAGAIPVERRQDAGGAPRDNEAMFGAAFRALQHGEAILIFPEGASQPQPALMPLHTGAARILLGAAANTTTTLEIALLPVGLHFDEPGAFRAGRALVTIGDAVPTADCRALYATDATAAVRRLTDRLAAALRRQIVEAEDRETLRLVRMLETAWREEAASAAADAGARAAWVRRATRAYRYLREHAPDETLRFRADVERYAKDLELAGISVRQVAQSYAASVAWRYTVRETLSLILGLPLALLGIALHIAPYQLTALAVRILRPDADVEATYKIFAAVVLYPLAWAWEAWLAGRVAGVVGVVVLLVALVPAGFFALTWRDRLSRFTREVRAFLGFLADRDLRRRLATRRRLLVIELERLAARVPASVLAGNGRDDRPG